MWRYLNLFILSSTLLREDLKLKNSLLKFKILTLLEFLFAYVYR